MTSKDQCIVRNNTFAPAPKHDALDRVIDQMVWEMGGGETARLLRDALARVEAANPNRAFAEDLSISIRDCTFIGGDPRITTKGAA